jgi:hypothetical protein
MVAVVAEGRRQLGKGKCPDDYRIKLIDCSGE